MNEKKSYVRCEILKGQLNVQIIKKNENMDIFKKQLKQNNMAR